jgi:HJR/Mrr/RecB family endonuclease
MLDKITNGQKTIESRWLVRRTAPWQKVSPGDLIFFKNSGDSVRIVATVASVDEIDQLNPAQVSKLLQRYHTELGIDSRDLAAYTKLFQAKRYVVLIFLKEVKPVAPFAIDKKGFSLQSAWLSVESIDQLRS